MLSIRNYFKYKDKNRLKQNEWESYAMLILMKRTHSGFTNIKVIFRAKNIIRNKEIHFVMIKD